MNNKTTMFSYMEQNILIHFPFEPYEAQRQMISKMIQAFENKQNAILESPTGSGKSLAILCASLAWINHKKNAVEPRTNVTTRDNSWKNNDRLDYDDDDDLNLLLNDDHWDCESSAQVSIDTGNNTTSSYYSRPKIYIGSRTHKQISQLVKELKQNTIYEPRMAVLGSRIQYCIEETVRKSENIQDECLKLCEFNIKTRGAQEKRKKDALSYDYSLAKRNYLSKMEDLAINNDTDDDEFEIVNDIDYKSVKKEEKEVDFDVLIDEESEEEDDIIDLESDVKVENKKKKKKNKKGKGKGNGKKDEPTYCKPFDNIPILEGHPDLRKGSSHALWDIEDLVKLGREVNGCPYYTSRTLSKEAEVIFCPYNYLIDPSIRASLQINLENDIVIIDEAHNIENICRDAGSFETTYLAIIRIQIELKEALRGRSLIEPNTKMLKVVNNMMKWLKDSDFNFNDGEKNEKVLKCWIGVQIIQQLERMEITKQSFLVDIKPAFEKILDHYDKQSTNDKANEADNQREEQEEIELDENNFIRRTTISSKSIRVLEKLILVLEFIFDGQNKYMEDYVLGVLKKKPEMAFGRQVEEPIKNILESMELCLWTMNPGIIFNQISRQTHSVILTSGTLTPMEAFVSELQAEFPVQLIASHVIDRSQVWAGVIPSGPNYVSLNGVFKTISTTPYQQGVGEALYNIANTVPYGVLCFFSSYRVMNLIINYIKSSGLYQSLEKKKEIFIEPRNASAEVFNNELKRYYKCIKDAEINNTGEKTGAFFFAVCRGKVSEGIDFNNNNCRAVICIGIPFPHFGDALIKLKQNYNNTKRNKARPHDRNKYLSGYDWYQIQGYRALNQALGRCIRHRKDWGAVILLERRFAQPEVRQYLSNWVKSLCKVHDGNFNMTMNNMRTFMNAHYEKDKQVRDQFILDHPEEYYNWNDCVSVTKEQQDRNLLIKLEQQQQEEDRKKKIKSEDNLDRVKLEEDGKRKIKLENDMDLTIAKLEQYSKEDAFLSELTQQLSSNKRVKTEYKEEEDWNQPSSSSKSIKAESKDNWQVPKTEEDYLFIDDWDVFLGLDKTKPKVKVENHHHPSVPNLSIENSTTDDDVIYISDSSISSSTCIVPETSTSSSSALKRKLPETSSTTTSNHKKKNYDVIEID